MAKTGWWPIAIFILLGTLWGSSFLWIKIGIEELDPATLVAYRVSLGALGMLIYLRLRGHWLPRAPRELVPLAVLGLVATALPFYLITWGELHVDSGTAAVLNSLTPIFVVIIAAGIIHTEPVSVMRAIGILTGFGGAVLLASREFALRDDPLALLGAAAVTVAALSYAIGGVYSRQQIHNTPRDVVAAGNLTFAAIYSWAFALASGANPAPPTQLDSIIAILWLGLLGSFLAFVMLYYLFDHLGATVTSTVTYMFPVVGVTLGVLFLSEVLDWRLALGTALVVVSFGLISLRYDRIVSWMRRGQSGA